MSSRKSVAHVATATFHLHFAIVKEVQRRGGLSFRNSSSGNERGSAITMGHETPDRGRYDEQVLLNMLLIAKAVVSGGGLCRTRYRKCAYWHDYMDRYVLAICSDTLWRLQPAAAGLTRMRAELDMAEQKSQDAGPFCRDVSDATSTIRRFAAMQEERIPRHRGSKVDI